MKYNKTYKGGDFQQYVKYLNTIRQKLSEQVYDFVSDPCRHDLGNQSLHDSRILKLEIIPNEDGANIFLQLLGNQREFKLGFSGVSQYYITQVIKGDMYKDLITYEIGIENDQFANEKTVFRAEFPFEEGTIEIFFDELIIDETIY